MNFGGQDTVWPHFSILLMKTIGCSKFHTLYSLASALNNHHWHKAFVSKKKKTMPILVVLFLLGFACLTCLSLRTNTVFSRYKLKEQGKIDPREWWIWTRISSYIISFYGKKDRMSFSLVKCVNVYLCFLLLAFLFKYVWIDDCVWVYALNLPLPSHFFPSKLFNYFFLHENECCCVMCVVGVFFLFEFWLVSIANVRWNYFQA